MPPLALKCSTRSDNIYSTSNKLLRSLKTNQKAQRILPCIWILKKQQQSEHYEISIEIELTIHAQSVLFRRISAITYFYKLNKDMETRWLCGLSLRIEQDNRWNYIWYSKQALESRFCIGRISMVSLPSTILDIMRNTCFKMNNPPSHTAFKSNQGELLFYCISLTLIMFGGFGIQPLKYSHTTPPVKI